VRHVASPEFWQAFEQLPTHVQAAANKKFELLKTSPRHPSLQFKKVGRLWSARASLSFRALAVEDGEEFVWFWIGPHDAYMQIIKTN
jgi:hypothetical protein